MSSRNIRESFDGSESNFSLVDNGFVDETATHPDGMHELEGRGTPSGYGARNTSIKAYYPISTILSNPRATSAAQTISTNLSNLNPLRPTTGPKTGATRGKAATPIVLSDLPKVTLKSFDPYIASIKEEYTAWSRVQTALADAPILDELDEDETLLDEETAKRKKAIKRALETSQLSSRFSKQLELPTLDTIPTIFFEENFNLANPRTFDVVTGGQAFKEMTSAEASGRRASNADLATDQILQEKLSHWLDVVELHLNVEISLRSASFFSALSNLQELDSQSAEAVHKIGELKRMLSSVDDSIARKGLEVIRQGVRRRRLTDLDIALERVKDVLKTVEQAEDLGEAGEIQGALDLADEIEREWESSKQDSSSFIPPTPSADPKSDPMAAIAEEEEDENQQTALPPPTPMTALKPRNDHHPPVRIANIKCMSGVPMRISTLRSHIAHALEHELEAVLVHVLREGCERLEATTEQWRSQPGAHLALYSELKDSISNRARAPLHGLVRCGKPALDDAISVWKDALLKEVRRLLRSLVPNTAAQDDDDTPAENSPSSRSSLDTGRPALDLSVASGGVQQLNQQDYLQLIRRLHTSMLGLLVLSDLESQAIAQVVSEHLKAKTRNDGIVTNEAALNEAWTTALQSELVDGVQAVAELINVRIARLVASRSEAHSHLTLEEFWVVFQETWQFVLDCEVVCRKMIVGLRGVIVSQAKAFLQQFHHRLFSEVAKAVELEQWSPTEVPEVTQNIVNRILESAVTTSTAWDFKNTAHQSQEPGTSAKQLAIEDKTYFVVGATLRCMEALENYLKVVVNLPLLSTDVMSRIIEFLKQFNSRVCQMVLGAGAMRSAGLKNITAKHLAMASQSISILISIIPYTRECLRRHLRAKQAVILVDFDKLRRDCQEHQNEIHAKLVAIMGDRLTVHCKTLQDIDWEKAGPADGKPNAYMETLVKETGTLHKVLLKYLAGNALEVVMMQVLSSINSRLAEEYGSIPLKSQQAKDRMLKDATYLKDKFAELKGLERPAPGAELEQLVLDKKVERPKPTPQPQGKQFSTPSLTQARRSFSGHVRTPSSASISKLQEIKEIEIPASTVTSQQSDVKEEISHQTTGPAPMADVNELVEPDSVAASIVDETQAHEVPLPTSPQHEEPPPSMETTAMLPEPLPEPQAVAAVESETIAPPTPVKDSRPLSPPVPENQSRVASPPITAVNVKNRLAGLFAKRPAIPVIDILPSIKILKHQDGSNTQFDTGRQQPILSSPSHAPSAETDNPVAQAHALQELSEQPLVDVKVEQEATVEPGAGPTSPHPGEILRTNSQTSLQEDLAGLTEPAVSEAVEALSEDNKEEEAPNLQHEACEIPLPLLGADAELDLSGTSDDQSEDNRERRQQLQMSPSAQQEPDSEHDMAAAPQLNETSHAAELEEHAETAVPDTSGSTEADTASGTDEFSDDGRKRNSLDEID